MNNLSCEFNMDTACEGLKLIDGTTISVDVTAVQNEAADNMYQCAERDYLTYSAQDVYVQLILNEGPKTYLKTIIVNELFESRVI